MFKAYFNEKMLPSHMKYEWSKRNPTNVVSFDHWQDEDQENKAVVQSCWKKRHIWWVTSENLRGQPIRPYTNLHFVQCSVPAMTSRDEGNSSLAQEIQILVNTTPHQSASDTIFDEQITVFKRRDAYVSEAQHKRAQWTSGMNMTSKKHFRTNRAGTLHNYSGQHNLDMRKARGSLGG